MNTISVNGQTIPLTGLPQTLSLPAPLNGLVSVSVNQHKLDRDLGLRDAAGRQWGPSAAVRSRRSVAG